MKLKEQINEISSNLKEESKRQKDQLEELKSMFGNVQSNLKTENQFHHLRTNVNPDITMHQTPEWILRERKRNNIIFGLREAEDDQAMVKSLFHDLGVDYEINNHNVNFRVGKSSNEKAMPLVKPLVKQVQNMKF